ncbi:MAG: nuclear transport factor 2 family protein [Acidimicrobiia bacterium]
MDELRALVQRYARAADERDIETLRSVFHPEASIEGLRGPLGLDDWLNTMRAPRTFPTSMHVLGDPLIDVADDAETANLDTYGVVYQLGDAPSGQRDLTMGVRYVDAVVRFEGRWVVRERVARTLWMR